MASSWLPEKSSPSLPSLLPSPSPHPPSSSPSSHPPSSSPSSHPPSSSPSPHSKWHKISPKRKPSSAWADLVEENQPHNNNKTHHKKQCIAQIMRWPKAKPKEKFLPPTPPSLCNISSSPLELDFYNHKEDGNKFIIRTLVACGDGRTVQGIDAEHSPRDGVVPSSSCDTSSCDDTHSTLSGDTMSLSSCDLSCDTLSCQSNDSTEGKKKKKHKKKKKRRNYSASEEGKKVFVGGIGFEECDASLSKGNETLAALRHQKFSQIFYLFGQVNRIQGHWDSGYCFVVFAKRKSAKLAIKCLSMATVRRKVVQNLRDNVGPSGVLPLSSFYVRWANNPTKPPAQTQLLHDHEVGGENEDDKEIEWVHAMKEEDMMEEDVERLMRDLKRMQCVM